MIWQHVHRLAGVGYILGCTCGMKLPTVRRDDHNIAPPAERTLHWRVALAQRRQTPRYSTERSGHSSHSTFCFNAWRYYSAANGTSQWYMIQSRLAVHLLLSWLSCPRRPPCPPASPLRRPLHVHMRASPRRPRQSQPPTRRSPPCSQRRARTTIPSTLPSTTARWPRSPSRHLPKRVRSAPTWSESRHSPLFEFSLSGSMFADSMIPGRPSTTPAVWLKLRAASRSPAKLGPAPAPLVLDVGSVTYEKQLVNARASRGLLREPRTKLDARGSV